MAYRWKQPVELNQQGKGAQDAFDAAYAARFAATRNPEASNASMQGYVPMGANYNTLGRQMQNATSMMQGYDPTASFPGAPSDQPAYAGQPSREAVYDENGNVIDRAPNNVSWEEQIRREELTAKINDLQTQLDQVNAQIAQIDKEMPGIGSREWEIAAKRAEIGDMSGYDNLVNRGNARLDNDRNAIQAIDKELQTARELTWALDSKDSENQKIALNKINMALEKAERESARTGRELGVDYYRLRDARDEFLSKGGLGTNGIINGDQWANKVYSAIKDGTYNKAMEAQALKFVKENPNDPRAKDISATIEANKGNTVEAKAKAKAYKDGSDALYNEAANMSKAQLEQWWRGLTEKQKTQFKKYHTIDLVKGKVG